MTLVSGQKNEPGDWFSELAGEWDLSVKDSELRKDFPYLSGSLVIKVEGQQVTIVRRLEDRYGTVERELIYFADGRGELNVWTTGDGKHEIARKSESKWKKSKLVINWSEKSNMGWYGVEEIYEIGSDRKRLNYTAIPRVATTSMFRPIFYSEKLVFTKK